MSVNIAPFPIRLHEADRPALLEHFVALDSEDRRLRFGSPIGDDGIRHYVARIDFRNDGVFAVQDDSLRIVAAIHVAHAGEEAELGLSVLPDYRAAGLGSALFARAVMHLRNRGTGAVFVHCLTENEAMMHIARKNSMKVAREGSETDARLELSPATPQTHLFEWMQDQQAQAVRAARHHVQFSRALFGLPA